MLPAIKDVLVVAEHVRKASVAFYVTAAPVVAFLATQDFSTLGGILAALSPVLVAGAVHQTVNAS